MSTAPASNRSRLASIVGEAHLLSDADEMRKYAADGVAPLAAVKPGTTDEVVELVRLANAERLALVAVGSGTKLGIGMPPVRYDVAVDITRMKRVIAFDPADLTLGVEAGIRLSELQRVLAEKNQFLPLMMPFYDRITIGGILASNQSGPQRQAFGTCRDFLLGMEFVTGYAAKAKSGGRVVKNVAGYDLHRLMIGSQGTLGIITAANFRTFPIPPAQATFVVAFRDAAGALELCGRIAQSHLSPHTLEITSPQMATLLDPEQRSLPAGAWSVLTAAAGKEAVVERHDRELRALAERAGAESFARLTHEEKSFVWSQVREFPSLAMAASPCAAVVKLALLPGAFARVLDLARQIAERNELPWAALVRAAGVIYFLLLPQEPKNDNFDRLALAGAELFAAADGCGGRALIEWCPAELKKRINVWGTPRQDWELMRRVKQVFDPDNVLSPGRFLGGI